MSGLVGHALEALRFAILRLTTYFFRAMGISSVSMRGLRSRLMLALEVLNSTNEELGEELDLSTLLWASWIGGITAEDQGAFVVYIRFYMQRIKISRLEELEALLEDFVILGRLHSSHEQTLLELVDRQLSGDRSTAATCIGPLNVVSIQLQ